MKVGFEVSRYNVNWDSKQFFNASPYGEKYTSHPIYASVYAQEKLEYPDYVINFGLRYDYRNADISYNATPDSLTAHYKKATASSRLSPRLGVSAVKVSCCSNSVSLFSSTNNRQTRPRNL